METLVNYKLTRKIILTRPWFQDRISKDNFKVYLSFPCSMNKLNWQFKIVKTFKMSKFKKLRIQLKLKSSKRRFLYHVHRACQNKKMNAQYQ